LKIIEKSDRLCVRKSMAIIFDQQREPKEDLELYAPSFRRIEHRKSLQNCGGQKTLVLQS
jgi:hypothetical protein